MLNITFTLNIFPSTIVSQDDKPLGTHKATFRRSLHPLTGSNIIITEYIALCAIINNTFIPLYCIVTYVCITIITHCIVSTPSPSSPLKASALDCILFQAGSDAVEADFDKILRDLCTSCKSLELVMLIIKNFPPELLCMKCDTLLSVSIELND